MKTTVKDIAAAAGVSPATVSNALNNRKGVSHDIRRMVMKTAKEMGYEKGSGVSGNTIRFVIFKRHGHVVADTPFFSSLIEGMERQCRALGYELLISHMSLEDDNLQDTADSMERDHAAGLVVLATEMLEEDTVFFRNAGMPVVMLDNCFRSSSYDSVLISNADASWQAVARLATLGHKEIGYLKSSFFIRNFQQRHRGYSEALADHGLTESGEHCLLLEPTVEGAYADMKKWLEASHPGLPTAFFADNDIIAFGAMKAMLEKGIRIPGDVSLIGFDDMPFCEMTTPRLSTVKVFKQEMGGIAVKRLVQLIETKDAVKLKTEVGTLLVIRDSQKSMM
jgi:DNA-binding LacI/PurR family transcriptional regulator